ncbi:MAG: RNA-binding S4 domain-containing protein [Candidatus Cloacimonetes bacterium]|nr:RNA-binding S4 domain-containing protein [Candidatus Cloacimonadota bacterium]
MKFWLKRESDFIFLDQFIKAMGWMEDYLDIRRILMDGRVQVNNTVEINRYFKLKEGDKVKYKDNFVQIVGGEFAQVLAKKNAATEHIKMGRRPQRWQEKTIKKSDK